LHDGEYQEVKNLGQNYNSEEHDHDPCIAPSESYLVWCSNRHGGYGENDFYITYNKENGQWTID